uniref:Uncharacterized protein n=1 Tax=Panagrolaimus davidi TaxID=227884 RepID=A0A914P3R4_9BILA
MCVLLGINAPDYIGDTNLTCLGISHALSAHLYYRVYKKHLMQGLSVSKVLTPSNRSAPSVTMIAVT